MTSTVRRRNRDDSGEYSDGSQDLDQNNSINDGGQPESDYDSQGSDSGSDRDGESQETERRVDDDEDRSNPQYIPKRGTFYEHDDRTAASGEETNNTASDTVSDKKEIETPVERRRPPRKSDIINKWSHDKYNENEQMPKSREELVSIYGYDIRNEDAPPHARRNRRYGRGPNKYTRTWEDEEAYRRQSAAQAPPRKPPNPEDFPELDASLKKHGKKPRSPRPRSKSQPASNESSENGAPLRRNASIKTPKIKPVAKPAFGKTNAPVKNVTTAPKSPAVKDKLPNLENLTITTTINNNNSQGQPQRKVNTSVMVAQQRPVPTEQARRKPIPTVQSHQQSTPPASKAPSNAQQSQPQTQHQPQQQSQPREQTGSEPRGGGSKRYSSLRQRPLAETYSPQAQQQQAQQQPQPQQTQQPQQQTQPQAQQQQPPHRYIAGPNEYVPPAQLQTAAAPTQIATQQHIMHQQVHRNAPPVAVGGPAHAPSPPHQAHPQSQHSAQQVRLGMMEQPPPLVQHPHHNLHNMPAHTIGQLQPSQGYAPPAMMPAQYMQSGSGPVLCTPAMYGQAPAPPYQHQMYPHHNYATQAGGVTYYNCAEQEPPPPQARAQRRPTAAIPIVRPHAPDRPTNSSVKDNIDRIVENMFVRKPYQAAHGADKEKSQSESRSSQEPQSKESSQPNSLTSSSISTDSKPSEVKEEKEKSEEDKEKQIVPQENVTSDA